MITTVLLEDRVEVRVPGFGLILLSHRPEHVEDIGMQVTIPKKMPESVYIFFIPEDPNEVEYVKESPAQVIEVYKPLKEE